MPVICAACHTENREHAMFCRGCAGKLPAFAATGPSVLEVMKSQRNAEAEEAADARGAQGRQAARRSAGGLGLSSILPGAVLSAEMRTFWIRLGLLMAAVMLAFVGWSSYVTRKVPLHGGAGADIGVPFDSAAAGVPPRSAVTTVVVVPPASSSTTTTMPSTLALPATAAIDTSADVPAPPAKPARDATASTSRSASSHAIAAAVAAAAAPPRMAAPVPVAPTAPAAPADPIALSASLSPGESSLPPGTETESRRPPLFTRREPRSAPPVRVAAADPRRGCEGMNFIFAAHCEAIHCDQAAFSANPRCDAVRAQRQRDLARRNLEF